MPRNSNKEGEDDSNVFPLFDDNDVHDWLSGGPVQNTPRGSTLGHPAFRHDATVGSGEIRGVVGSPRQQHVLHIVGGLAAIFGTVARIAVITGVFSLAVWFAVWATKGMLASIG